MQKLIITLFLNLIFFGVLAQDSANSPNDYTVSFKQLGPDSAVIYYEAGRHLVKPECAVTYRYVKMSADGFFTGPFKDYNRDSILTLSGTYNNNLKEGLFEAFHWGGQPEFSGFYESNRRTGLWRYWYENGKPQITLRFTQDSVYILEAWNRDGKQTVTDGKGTVKIENFDIIEGKVKNGLMDGQWLYHRRDGYIYFQEKFADGRFIKGTTPRDTYQVKSRFRFLNEPDAIIKSENLEFSPNCVFIKPRDKRKITLPIYKRGNEHINNDFSTMVRNRSMSQEGPAFEGIINVDFTISKNGEIKDIVGRAPFHTASPSLIQELEKIVANSGQWQHALLEQQPVDYSMQLHVKFEQGKFFTEVRFFAPLEK